MITAKRAGIPFPLLASLLSSLVSGFHFAVSYQWVQNMNGERRRGRIVSTKTHFLWKYLHKFCWIHYFLLSSPRVPAERLFRWPSLHFSPGFNKKHTSTRDEPFQQEEYFAENLLGVVIYWYKATLRPFILSSICTYMDFSIHSILETARAISAQSLHNHPIWLQIISLPSIFLTQHSGRCRLLRRTNV